MYFASTQDAEGMRQASRELSEARAINRAASQSKKYPPERQLIDG